MRCGHPMSHPIVGEWERRALARTWRILPIALRETNTLLLLQLQHTFCGTAGTVASEAGEGQCGVGVLVGAANGEGCAKGRVRARVEHNFLIPPFLTHCGAPPHL